MTRPEERPSGTFTLLPRGPFSLGLAASHVFGPRDPAPVRPLMRLAFCVDGYAQLAGVVLTERSDGAIAGEIRGATDIAAVRDQVARIVSLDHDGTGWPAVGRRDSLIGRLQARYPGFRPVLHHSPYEAAAWAVLAGHRSGRQADSLRRRLGESLGRTFLLDGEELTAFPTPQAILDAPALPLPSPEQDRRLRAVARAALDGVLDPARLRALDPDEARARIQALPGLGPFYAGLVAIRAVGPTDAPTVEGDRLLGVLRHYEGDEAPRDTAGLTSRMERWRPFRTWSVVLLRRAAYEDGVG
ncbi:MAG: DNA-3-methyladenine glycosylase family protein [Candidatus Limnocylindrales bacterium]